MRGRQEKVSNEMPDLSQLSDTELQGLAQSRGISLPSNSVAQAAPPLTDLSDDELQDLASSRGIDLPGSSPKKSGVDWNAAAKSFAGNILPGLAELPEAAINAYQRWGRSQATMPGGSPLLSQGLSYAIPKLNEAMGQAPDPYLRGTDALRNMPLPGSVFQNQTPNQLAMQNPVAAGFGSAAGQTPYFMAGGEMAGLSKLPLALRIGASALGMGATNATAAGLQEFSDQAKANDTTDWQKVGQTSYDAFNQGAVLGGIGGAFSKAAPPLQDLKRIGYNWPRIEMKKGPFAPPAIPSMESPKRIEMKGPLITPGPTEQLRQQGNRLFGRVEKVHGEVMPEGHITPSTPETGLKAKQGKLQPKITVVAEPTPPSEVIHNRVENIVDPDKSWRGAREQVARIATAQEAPLARDLARNKVNADAARAKLFGAVRQMYALLKLDVPKRAQNIDPKYAFELQQIAKDLGGESKKVSYTEATLSPHDKFPEEYNFKGTTLDQKMGEIRDLDKEFKSAESKYDNFKDNHEEEFSETFPLNETIQIKVSTQKYGERSVNIKRVWRAEEYEFKKPGATEKYQAEREARRNLSQPYEELGTPTFKAVIQDVADKGNHLEIEGLADRGALDWFKSKPKADQAKIVLAIGIAASIMAGNQQAQSAPPPPKLVAKVITQLYKGGFKEWMGSRPITRILQLEMTSDMIRKGFDATSKAFGQKRFNYIQQLKRATVGSRTMTDAERQAVAGLRPWEIRRTPKLVGWTQAQKNKAGDIAQLHAEYRDALKAEKNRVEGLKVQPGHFGAASRYLRGLDFDAKDMGVGLDYDPSGGSNQFLNKLSGEVMISEFTGNYRVMGLHLLEAITASASKHRVAFGEVLAKLPTNQTYRDFAKANAPKGFFQQRLEAQQGFGFRQAVSKAINEPIDNFIKSLPHGEIIYQGLSAQLGERGKLGLNAVVIAQALAKDYPGGPEMYMRRWLDNAERRIPIPPNEEIEFNKIALKAAIEENTATASLPHGLLTERSIMQRNKAMGFFEPFSYGKLVQSRFCMSIADDFLEAAAKGDKMGMLNAAKAGIVASLMVGAVSGSHAVSPFVWAALEQVDSSVYGTNKDIEALKINIDALQKNWGPGYQIQKYGVAGIAFTRFPTTAVGDMWDRFLRDAKPKTKADIMRFMFDFATAAFISRIGPQGTLNLDYMLERINRGLKGYEQFKQYESSPQGVMMDKIQNRPFATKLYDKKLRDFNLGQGILHAFVDIENPSEVKGIQKGEQQSAINWRKDTKDFGKSWIKAAKSKK